MRYSIKLIALCALVVSLASSCGSRGGGETSSSTGWNYNDTEWGGFEKVDYEGQINGPNLQLVEGGTFSMGLTQQDVTYEWNNIPRRVTVSSFYMDETEVTNLDWREYLYFLKRVYTTYPEVWRDALPDSLVWREELAFNEPFVETYFRHPSYDDYPVVGVSWDQVQNFCDWRSDRVNYMLLVNRGVLNPNTGDEKDGETFNSKAYLVGQYEGSVRKNLPDMQTGGERPVRFEDGILLPNYRLPTEAEWEYAALALQGNQTLHKDELITDRRFFPWNGNTARYQKHNKNQGKILANFKRGRGDYMGMAGALNDEAHIPGPVRSFMPNDFGLYNMAGNVSEWVQDVYRPLTATTLRDPENHDLNPFRGNQFEELILDEEGKPIEKDSLGRLQYRSIDDEEVLERENYQRGDVIDYRDGDNDEFINYDYGVHTLISDKSRVVKGGSWADRLFWISPGARRFKDQDKADRTIGFRCAMTRVGGPVGNEDAAGTEFKENKRKIPRRYK
jgi:gliding motility-associated lipoprotein GldJ